MLTDEQRDFAIGFHTVLRKSLDSTSSSICWNAIYLLEKEDWENFIVEVHGNLTRSACEEAMPYGNAARNLFRIGLEMLEDGEYEVLVKYTEAET